MIRRRQTNSRGSVLVFVAAAMFPIAAMMTFAIDISHWFDYSRNLQNRADAAALAAGAEYGNICFTGNAGDQWTGAQSAIGKWAQLYSGPGDASTGATAQGSAAGDPNANVPYTDGSVLGVDGRSATYINETNLKLGSLDQYFVRLNADDFADKGGVNFAMGDFCNAAPKLDKTDKHPGDPGAMVDVKVTQRQLPNFIPIFNVKPNISAHSRVELRNEISSPGVRPIAVRDAAFTPCVSVRFVNATTNAVIQTIDLTKKPPQSLNDPVQWDNSASPTSLPIPDGANVYVQPFLRLCGGDGQIYDDSTNTGLLYINSHPASDPSIGSGDGPKLTSGGVTLTGGCAPDQYFSAGGCSATIHVWAEFAPDVKKKDAVLTVADTAGGNPITLTPTNYNAGSPTEWTGTVTIPDQDGLHQFRITWEQQGQAIGTTLCTNGANNPCKGSFGIQQQAFGACDGCDQPNDSGPVTLIQLSQPGVGSLTNSLPAGTNQQLVVTVQLIGVAAAKAGDPSTVLRFGGGQQTGLIDCGQGTGASADEKAIAGGCGPQNPAFTNPPLNPLYINQRNGACFPQWPGGNHQDCVQTTPGERRTKIPGAIANLITKNGTSCPANDWTAASKYIVDPNSPRAVTMIITSDVDLTQAHGGSQPWIPIWQFATFYVTGWDAQGGQTPKCNNNAAYPGKGKKNLQNGAIWGVWITYTEFGIGGEETCKLNQLGNCVPVLTR